MADLHTHQFYAARIATTTRTALYTVPAGHVIRVRFVHLANFSGVTHQPIISVDTGFIIVAPNMGSGTVYDWEGFVVFNAGQTIYYSCSSSASTDIIISGYLYFV